MSGYGWRTLRMLAKSHFQIRSFKTLCTLIALGKRLATTNSCRCAVSILWVFFLQSFFRLCIVLISLRASNVVAYRLVQVSNVIIRSTRHLPSHSRPRFCTEPYRSVNIF
jgi:hypothetical protein